MRSWKRVSAVGVEWIQAITGHVLGSERDSGSKRLIFRNAVLGERGRGCGFQLSPTCVHVEWPLVGWQLNSLI